MIEEKEDEGYFDPLKVILISTAVFVLLCIALLLLVSAATSESEPERLAVIIRRDGGMNYQIFTDFDNTPSETCYEDGKFCILIIPHTDADEFLETYKILVEE